jgi:adenylate cyclase
LGKSLPEPVRYWNAFAEISIPTLGMYILSASVPAVITLVSPVVALYFVFIFLSILRLNVVLSVFTGAVAALQYGGLAWFFATEGGEAISPVFETSALYIARSGMLLAAGIVAGIISRVIREKIVSSVRHAEERNQAIDLFGQQVSEPVARELLENPASAAGEMREVSVMFLDIREFTPFAEAHAPSEVVEYLNTLFAAMIRIIGRHHGIVNQFLGDGFMTTFGAPIQDEKHAEQAVASAREILAEIEVMAREHRIPPTKIGIGIHSGQALTGNIGSEERRQYSVTGTTVILASRVEQLNKQYGSSILVTADTFEKARLRPSDGLLLENVGVKGHNRPLNLYRLA